MHASDDVFDRRIDVQVKRLRRELEADPFSPKMILTHRGVDTYCVRRRAIRTAAVRHAAASTGSVRTHHVEQTHDPDNLDCQRRGDERDVVPFGS
ncbi:MULTISPECIES: winged helix-turn-helix domain-containing protein [unclassified Bradyrhizobium]